MTEGRKLPEGRIARLPLPERLDVKAIELLRPWLQKRAVKRLGQLGNIADEPPLLLLSSAIVTAGLLYRNPKLQRTGFRMVLAHLIAMGLKEWGKNNIDRTRPAQQLREGSYHMKQGKSHADRLRAFPSGHTAGALAIARAFSREYPRYTKPVLAAAAMAGVLQVTRRAHYPGDVLAGGVAGAIAEKVADLIIYQILRLQAAREARA